MTNSNTPEFSYRTRKLLLSDLVQKHTLKKPAVFDAVIVGGGIVGAGLARELSIRGLTTLLVEKNDFASGTSSKSSKLIHGGLRYLEMYDFHLVFESLSERHWLLKTHPHLVHPLKFALPIYDKSNAPPGARSPFLLSLGLWLYDILSLFRTPFFHGRYSQAQMQKKFPNLRNEGLKGGFFYADAMMLDDELVLECIFDSFCRGAKALNYVEVKKINEKRADNLFVVELADALPEKAFDDHKHSDGFQVMAREVIVCVGPWTEKFGNARVAGGAGRKLKPSKGVHIVFPFEKLPVQECLVMYAPDGRIVFTIPRLDLGKGAEVVIVGTTDSPEQKDPSEVKAEEGDVQYLLSVLSRYFPERNLKASDIISSFAGVRPLLDEGEESEAKTSREHEIWKNSEGVTFMAGGKYTTFRKISQEIADFTFPHTKKNTSESRVPLSSAQDYEKRLSGTPVWGKFTDNWIKWKMLHHMPCTIEDVTHRRLPLWLAGKNIPPSILEKVLRVISEH